MKLRKLLLIVCLMGMQANASSPSGAVGILVPATPPCDEIDGEMEAAFTRAEAVTEAIGQDILVAEDPSENSCIPSLENIGTMINGALPRAFTMSALLTRIRDAACAEMDRAVDRALNKYQVVARAPYGLGHVRVGIGEAGDHDNTGIIDNGKSVFDPLAQEIIKTGGAVARDAVESVADEVPNAEGINRTIRSETNSANSEYRNSVDSAREALNGL